MKKYKLPKEFTEKWLEALESGKYKQGQSYLFDGDESYCCLGVACKTVGISDKVITDKGVIHDVINSVSKEEILAVPDILLKRDTSSFSNLVSNLVELNDGTLSKVAVKRYKEEGIEFPHEDFYNYTFKDIADFIRLNVELV